MKQALPYIPVSPAKIMLAVGVAQIWGNTELVGAMFKLAMHTWVHGPVDAETLFRIVSNNCVIELRVAGVIADDGTHYSIPWVEEARTETDARRVANAAKAKKAAKARWSASSKHATSMLNDASKESKESKESNSQLFGKELTTVTTDVETPARRRAGGGGTPATRAWDDAWFAARGARWAWQAKDAAAVAKCMKMAGEGGLDEFVRRANAMLSSQDRWVAQNASPQTLMGHWNRFSVEFRPLSKTDIAMQPTQEASDLYNRIKGVISR